MITPLGSLGTATVKSAGVPLTFSPSRTVPVGRFVALFVSTDSVHNSGGPHGPMQERWAAHDDAGNIWVTLGGVTDGDCFFRCGASSHIFVTQLRRQLTTASVITITNQAEANITAKAISAEEFDLGAGMTWATTHSGPAIAESLGPTDPVAIGIGSLVNQEYVFLHCLGWEGPNTDAFTWDADYTQIVAAGTSGGVDDTNISVHGGYRVATLTADTVDITAVTAFRDHTQVLVAVCAAPVDTRFPESPVLDDFNRADEEPLDNGGAWRTDVSAGPSSPGSPRFMAVVGNQAKGGAATGAGGQFWDEIFFGCAEIKVDIPVQPPGGGGGPNIFLHGSGDTSAANFGAGAACRWVTPVFGNTTRDSIIFGQGANAGGVAAPKFRAWVDINDGYKLGMKRSQNVTTTDAIDRLFVDIGDGWEQIGAVQRNQGILAPGPGLIFHTGRPGIAVWDSVTELDNFGVMDVECFFGRPQIIRYR